MNQLVVYSIHSGREFIMRECYGPPLTEIQKIKLNELEVVEFSFLLKSWKRNISYREDWKKLTVIDVPNPKRKIYPQSLGTYNNTIRTCKITNGVIGGIVYHGNMKIPEWKKLLKETSGQDA